MADPVSSVAPSRRRLVPVIGLALVVVAAAVRLALGWAGPASGQSSMPGPTPGASPEVRPALHAVVTRRPERVPGVDAGLQDGAGRPVVIACGTCHATTRPRPEIRDAAVLTNFHQGLRYVHGGMSCLSCHNASDYDTLRLADSSPVAFRDAMTLCSQCHGSQRRDYEQGLHGGMNGHWDLRRGGRERHACVHCHDPHSPAFPLVRPVLPPKDRITVPPPAGVTH